ncbi:MAG: hypothetical protein IJ801_09230 [Lachnospiraceae bacterium]|nr:hypothetical protein [Lachnospiraceae bacterium]
MVFSGQKYDLSQMKEYFEKQIPQIRLLSDLSLSEADYKSLGARLKAAFTFSNRKEGLEDTMICHLVYWVYALVYREEDSGLCNELTEFCADLSQYQARHHMQLLLDTFANYNIDDFGYKEGTVEERCFRLIARHAGIPNDEKFQVFDLMEPYRQQNVSVDTMMEEIYSGLPYRSRYIFSLLDSSSRQEVIWEIRRLMEAVCSGSLTREEILMQYPTISACLVDYCFYWQESKSAMDQAK